jgi:FdhD protein
MSDAVKTVWRRLVGHDGAHDGERTIPQETAIAFTYDGSSHAVMMATPADLEDFAIGFSLTEGIVRSPAEIEALEAIEQTIGIELRMRLAAPRSIRLAERRRVLAGPVGCGLCGLDSLEEARSAVPHVTADHQIRAPSVFAALKAMHPAQALNQETHAVHAAGYFTEGDGLVALREDIGRHNALDKLAGALAGAGISPTAGIIVLTSRLSYDLVKKAAMIGVPILAAVSTPTALAIAEAEAARMTLIGIGRDDSFEIFTCPERIKTEPALHVL